MHRMYRIKYDMFVRVSAFGKTQQDLFPKASAAGEAFSVVAQALETIDDQLTKKVLAAAEARKVKVTTRKAVTDQMRIIGRTARRLAKDEAAQNPFLMPKGSSAPILLSTARAFIEAAEPKHEQFVRLGLPPDFITVLQARVKALQQAVAGRQRGRSERRSAQAGIKAAFARGSEAIRDLEVIVENAVRQDPARLGAWQGARRLERSSGSGTRRPDVVPPAPPAPPVVVEPPVTPAPAALPAPATPAAAPCGDLSKAS